MSVISNLNRALARAQLDTITIALTWAIADVANVTINGKTVSYTAAVATIADVVAGLLAALQTSTIPEFLEVTWASPGAGTITGTSTTAGIPFTIVCSETTAGNGTCTSATTTAATGPYHWNDANNWLGGAVPVNADEVNVDLSKGSFLYGMDQSAVTLASLRVFRSTTTQNRLALPIINASGYTEYRDTFLKIGATECVVDADCPVAINFGSVQVAFEQFRSYAGFNGVPESRFLGTHASNTWEISGGFAGIGLFAGVASNGATLRVGRSGQAICGPDVVVTSINNAGRLDYEGTFTDWTNEEGTADIRGTQAATSLDVFGGQVNKRFNGLIGAVVVEGGRLDCSLDPSNPTFTRMTLGKGGTFYDPDDSVTLTNGIEKGDGVSTLTAA